MEAITKREFIKITSAGVAGAIFGGSAILANAEADTGGVLPELKKIGSKFRFVIVADPHICGKNETSEVAVHSQANLKKAVAEINSMTPAPAFVVHIGDMTHVPNAHAISHWEECVAPLTAAQVLVHGNHDGHPPYETFIAMQKKKNGITSPFYSFDCGMWHFVSIPCNLNGGDALTAKMEGDMFSFLEDDLKKSKDRPTIILHHYHFLPVGLSQTEWYFYNLSTRKKLLDLYTRHGNVKWAFNGHVHNGVLATQKTSWTYRGINFVNSPTIIIGRPYGEEAQGFERGLQEGGYYLVVDVDHEELKVAGKLVDNPNPYVFPSSFQSFDEATEPRLFKTMGQLAVGASLLNGNFESGTSGWSFPWRYEKEKNPAFTAGIVNDTTHSTGRALSIRTSEGGVSEAWTGDEYYEGYQVVSIRDTPNPVISLDFKIAHNPLAGGGYVRVEALSDSDFKLFMFYWGDHEESSDYYPRCVGYSLLGKAQNWLFFEQMQKRRQGFYWKLNITDDQWHKLVINVPDLYDGVTGSKGAFSKLGMDRLAIAVGTWNGREVGTYSESNFAGISMRNGDGHSQSLCDQAVLDSASETSDIKFGMNLEEKVKAKKDKVNA